MPSNLAGFIFLILSAVFFALVFRDYSANDRHLTPAARIWLRIAVIFGFVAIVLFAALI
ncbi:MAG: hypothetical protein IBX56_01610 [Methylomicrobium sp.]|nr:hypothetical protein [Methylomicrobium sp.]